ncbi:choice-of-anchor G family protein [Microbacterium sp. 3J1]|uniref:choice-of-anchor G family protein n=1 Tax=Microbacterium sp. 3J1 TaxID=861269 RepID=UPI00159EBCF4|nr:choice-of-anchor G family protein [Microbacterium sp. 3J1]
MVLASALIPSAANALDAADPSDPSVAQGQIIQLPAGLLGGLDIAALGHTVTSNPSAPGSELGGLDVGVLEALSIDVGTLNVPLLTDGTTPGLLQLGDLGGTQSFSSSPTQTQSVASSGTVTSGGAIDTGAIDGSTTPAQLELTDLFDQLGVAGLTDAILDEASIGIGALASRADSTTGVATSEYRISDLGLDLHSNLVAGLSTTLASTIQGTLTPVSDLVGPTGALTGLVTTVVNTIDAIPNIPLVAAFEATGGTVSIAGLDTVGQTVASEVLLEPLENTTGSVLVDLSDGTISVDLAAILVETGAGADLNSLPANTDVLSATTIAAIQQGITSALTGTHPESLNGKITSILDTTIEALQATITVGVDLTNPLTGIDLVSGDVTIQGSLAQFAGTATPAPTVTTDISLAGLNIGALLNPVVSALTGAIAGSTGPLVDTALTSVIPLLQPALAATTGPVLTALDPVLAGVLSEVADITINEQLMPGGIPGDSFTVRALAVDLLPAVGGGVSLDLGSSTVKAAVAAVALLDAAETVQAGIDLAVTGSGWPASTEVSVQLTAPGGAAVGAPVPVTTDATGGFTVAYPVPASAEAGAGYTVTATAGTVSATDTTEVTAAAAVDAAPAVQEGTDLAVSGTNWPASTQVSVQLTAPGTGAAIGGPVVVTTDGTGFFTTAYPVPAGTPAATGYTVTATAGTQSATDTTEVTAVPVPTVDAAATVQAGTDLAVSGTTWPADTEVSVQLTAPGGEAVGGPEVVTTDGTGGFTLAYPVPATATPGTDYTVTATVGTQVATDTTDVTAAATVDAAPTVEDGADLPVTGTGWPADTEVTVQLTGPGGGANVGGPVTVTTGALGGFSIDYPVPAGTPAGVGYTVTARVGTQTATDTTEVTDAPETVEVASSVPAGTNLAVTGSGWPLDTTVSLQLTAPGGENVGGPVSATTDGTGAFTATYPVPSDATPATGYTLTATAGAETATDTTEVTAGDPDDANTNAAASASASADATADADPSAQAAAEAAALADATSAASAAATADATAAAEAAATTDATTTASSDATSTANASAAIAAQAAALADASDDADASASTAAESNSAASSESAATTDSSSDASSEASTNANAAASASASADADASTAAVAEASAQAAAFADATAEGSAAADPTAEAAAQTAATATATTAATADSTSDANAGAAIAAQAAALADATTDTTAEASATSDASTSAASNSSAAAIATASSDASSDAVASASADASAELNTNASASATASAQADSDANAAVEAAAVAAALADATSTASAAADVTADAAASAAATDDASTDASTTATTDANASAAAAAQAAADTAAENDATATSAADASASADADPTASAAAAANASSSATASASAAADATAEAEAEAAASATASSSASAAASASADAGADPTGSIAITVQIPSLERGQQQTAVGTGFQPGEVVTGVMTSEPLALGTQVANAQGTVTFVWTIPADSDLGTHTVTLTGAASGSVAATFQVVASGLAATGGQVQGGWIALAALLLMLGLGAMRVARPRRAMVDTE